MKIDAVAKDVSPDDFMGLLIPGGFSPDVLRSDDSIVDFVRNYFTLDKPLFTICHGPQLLVTAEVLRGRTLTCYKSIIVDVKNAGANYVDREVVVDRNLVTSRTPKDLPVFIKASLKKLNE